MKNEGLGGGFVGALVDTRSERGERFLDLRLDDCGGESLEIRKAGQSLQLQRMEAKHTESGIRKSPHLNVCQARAPLYCSIEYHTYQ